MVSTFLGVALLGSEWVLWLLVILSIVFIAVVLERTLFFIKIRIDLDSFTYELSKLLNDKKYDSIKDFCKNSSQSLESDIVFKGIDEYLTTNQKQKAQESMEYLIGRHRQSLDKRLLLLGTLGNNAPFIGLLGTVLGIIRSFHDLGLNPAGGSSVVMAGISEALVATAVGLLVAIPAVVFFNYFKKLSKIHTMNEISLVEFIISKLD